MLVDSDKVPLSDVAEDLRDLVRAYRENGEISFQDVPLEQSRLNYERSCAANGLASMKLPWVRDHDVAVSGGSIVVREYRPSESGQNLPAIIFLHGGGWVLGSLETHDPLCRLLAHDTGAVVLAVEYRLSPENRFPIPLRDCVEALQWITDNAVALKVDLNSLAIAGDSAGGNLAAVLSNTKSLKPEGLTFLAHALLYPVTDMRGQTASYQRIRSGFPLTAGSMHWFRQHYVDPQHNPSDPMLSPLLAAELPQMPLFIVTCGLDPLADEGISYAGKAACGGAHVEHHHLPRHAHGLFTSAGKITTGHVLVHRMGAFLRTQLGGT